MKLRPLWQACGLAMVLNFWQTPTAYAGQAEVAAPPAPILSPTYADLVDLADSTTMVLLVQARKTAVVEPGRAPGVRRGWVRLYVEAQLVGVLRGGLPTSDSLRYLADVSLDSKGKPPSLKKDTFVIFARSGGQPGELQLVAPDAQLAADPPRVAQLRKILGQLATPDAPGRITNVYEALYEQGTLAGEGETQIFLTTASGAPASITVTHRPAQPTRWSASFSEVVNADGTPPPPETLAWYRLACFLPARLPAAANVSDNPEDKAQAEADYSFVRQDMGACTRTRAGA